MTARAFIDHTIVRLDRLNSQAAEIRRSVLKMAVYLQIGNDEPLRRRCVVACLKAGLLESPIESLNDDIEVQWNTPQDTSVVQLQIQYQLVGASTWLSAPAADISLNYQWISNVVPAATYNVQIRSTRANGVSSGWVQVLNYTVEATPTYLGTLSAQLPTITANSQLAAVAPNEMLVNSNFANATTGNVTGWTLSNGSGELTISTAEFHNGTQSLQLQNQTATQTVNLQAGHTYLVSVWVMTDGGVVGTGAVGAGLYVAVSSGTITDIAANEPDQFSSPIMSVAAPATGAISWLQLEAVFSVDTTGTATINLQNSVGGGVVSANAWFAGASLTDVTTSQAVIGGTAASLITPIANLMPAQAGADATAQQPIVYTGTTSNIVPNGNFILGNTQGWLLNGFSYGPDTPGPRIYSPPNGSALGAISPAFQVVPGEKYRINFTVYNGTGSGGIYLRLAWQPEMTNNADPNNAGSGGGYQDFLPNGSVTGTPTVYSYDWTCPAGRYFASACVYAIGASDLACQSVSCIPYAAAAQWGADQTSSNTAADTSSVDGVPASTIASVVPTGYKLYINSGNRSYSIQAI